MPLENLLTSEEINKMKRMVENANSVVVNFNATEAKAMRNAVFTNERVSEDILENIFMKSIRTTYMRILTAFDQLQR